MEQIMFKEWQLGASTVDTDILRLDIEARDGTDIIEVGDGPAAARDGEQYARRFTTQKIEDAHRQAARRASDAEPGAGDGDEDESATTWLADEDETLYLRGWEVTAVIDEEGLLNVYVEKGGDADIFDVEPLESGAPLGSHVMLRLAAEESDEDEDEDEEEDKGDLDDDEGYEEIDEFDELDDEYDGEYEEDDDGEEDEEDAEEVLGENDRY